MKNDINKLIKLYTDIFYLEDTGVIPLICAVMLSHHMPGDPIWLMLIGPSSGGKTELINAVQEVGNVHQVSLLTENTLLSGMNRGDKEASLLIQIGDGVITMKDFTSILSMNAEAQQAIMGQLREVYDGRLVKHTGTGEKLEWNGKITFIGGVTEKIHNMQDKFSGFGTRSLQYTLVPQDRKKTTKRAQEIFPKIEQYRLEIQEGFKDFMNGMEEKAREAKFETLDADTVDAIINIADFSAIARSPVERDYRKKMELALSEEYPMRMSNMLFKVANALMLLNDNKGLTKQYEDIIYKIALDSIPKQRRMILQALGKYSYVTAAAVATQIKYPTDIVLQWLEDLYVLNLCDRISAGNSYHWKLVAEYLPIIERYEGIQRTDEALDGGDEEDWFGPAYGQEIDKSYAETQARLKQQNEKQQRLDT